MVQIGITKYENHEIRIRFKYALLFHNFLRNCGRVAESVASIEVC